MTPARPITRHFQIALIAASCAAAAAACGVASSTLPGSPGPAASSPAAPQVSLSITASSSPGRPGGHWTLTCDPTGGTHPDAAAACAQLLAVKNPFAPIPAGTVCPQIMLSDAEATIQGSYFGQPVDTVLRDGGCTLSLWAKLSKVIGG